MRRTVLIAAALAATPVALAAQDADLERVRRILSEVPLFDGHNDLPSAIRDATSEHGDWRA